MGSQSHFCHAWGIHDLFDGIPVYSQTTKTHSAKSFSLPTRRDIDLPLVFGSLLFGLGWGLVGFCPGPALVALVTGYDSVLIFVLAMGFGMYAFEVIDSRFKGDPDGSAGLIIQR